MAAVTNTLGFGITACTTFEPPFLLAKRFSTLDHLTEGRVAWVSFPNEFLGPWLTRWRILSRLGRIVQHVPMDSMLYQNTTRDM
jgi:hypothetical protein